MRNGHEMLRSVGDGQARALSHNNHMQGRRQLNRRTTTASSETRFARCLCKSLGALRITDTRMNVMATTDKLPCISLVMTIVLSCSTDVKHPSTVHEQGPQLEVEGIELLASFTGCLESGPSRLPSGAAKSSSREPKIQANDASITYSRGAEHNCCYEAELQHVALGSTIEIREIWRGEACRCNCYSDLSVALSPIPSGKYLVMISYVEDPTSDEALPVEERMLLSQEVVVP